MKRVEYNTNRGALINVPLPQETDTYKPITHEELINLTLESIAQSGFELQNESYRQSSGGLVATGRYNIKNLADKDMQLSIGWQNSYNKQVTLKFALGVYIMLCQNGCVSGDMGSFRRKHTGDVQIFTPKTISEYFKTAHEVFAEMQRERDRMKEITLDRRTQAELIGRMYLDNEFIESTQLNVIKRELDHPTHNYESPNSLWELYQFTTYSLKSTPPADWMKCHIEAHKFFTNEAGILIEKRPALISMSGVPENQLSILDEIAEHEREEELVLVPVTREGTDDVIY